MKVVCQPDAEDIQTIFYKAILSRNTASLK